MSYLGDFALGSTFDMKFCTVDSTGLPTTMAGSPAVVAYPDNSTTEVTAGITLTYTAGFDSVAGLANVRVVATSGNGYATGTNYALVVSAGTVGGVSVAGYVIGHFSIEARSGLRPTTAGRTLDVSATGEAGVDWANVGSPTTTVDLSGTTIKTTQKVDVDTIKTNPVVNGGTITFPTNATVASTTNITSASGVALAASQHVIVDSGTVTTVTNQLTAAQIATGIWQDTTAGDFTVALSVGKSIMNGVTLGTGLTIASVSGAVGSVTGSVGSVTGLTASDVGAIKTVTDKFVFTVANQVDANIQYVNDVQVNGNGSPGTEWGP